MSPHGFSEYAYPALDCDFLTTNPMTTPMEKDIISKTDATQNENIATLHWRVSTLESQVHELSASAKQTLESVSGLQAVTRTQGQWMFGLLVAMVLIVVAAVLRSSIGG